MMLKTLRSFVLTLALLMSARSVVAAHSFPEEQHPAAGQSLPTGPSEVRIKFDAPVEKLFAKLQVLDSSGKNHAAGTPQVSDDGIYLSTKLDTLSPGEYTVRWAVVCVDTHHTEGSYSFAVAGGGA